jgi:predicted MFS family arabinose efflux permease
MLLAGPLAGVVLDRLDRKQIMITSDLVRLVIALAFMLTINPRNTWLLFPLSGALMFASPFFTSGRSSILPTIATKEELHTANALTQTTGWITLTLGAMLGGLSVKQFGYHWSFVLNSFSFLFSAFCIWQLHVTKGTFRVNRSAVTEADVMRPWHDYREGLRYMRAFPLLFGIAMIHAGWATGGGAAQILFGLFGDQVFHKGSIGIGVIWGFAGVGLVLGGLVGNLLGKRIGFQTYKRVIAVSYFVHGATYVAFSQMEQFSAALLFICLSRSAVAVSSVLNTGQLLRHVSNEYRGRVFATIETITWSVMMVSMTIAGMASQHLSPRTIGAWAGVMSSLTAVYWAWSNWKGRLPEPARAGVEAAEVEVHGEPTG